MISDGIEPENEELFYQKSINSIIKRKFNEYNIHTIFVHQDDIQNLGIFSKYLELLYIKICSNFRESKYNNNYIAIACGYLDKFRHKKEKIKHFLKKMKILTSYYTKGSCISPKHYRFCVNLSNKYIDFNNPDNTISPLIWYHHDTRRNNYDIRWSGNMEYLKNYIQTYLETENFDDSNEDSHQDSDDLEMDHLDRWEDFRSRAKDSI